MNQAGAKMGALLRSDIPSVKHGSLASPRVPFQIRCGKFGQCRLVAIRRRGAHRRILPARHSLPAARRHDLRFVQPTLGIGPPGTCRSDADEHHKDGGGDETVDRGHYRAPHLSSCLRRASCTLRWIKSRSPKVCRMPRSIVETCREHHAKAFRRHS